ncbi:MAG: GIY-YIG nuclease family protein [Bacteroidetes bacterium]|nr:GIY-YIG nuclease family protein [Bacteroidota bacterium]
MYAIIDIETTGLSPKRERITEVAIFVHDGQSVVDQYSTLINPERLISPVVTSLTGITNSMVEDAPKFYEIAKRIVEITKECVFVAHNASFDYNFIKEEFHNLGYEFNRKTLCTVKLSRKLIPGHPSYSLGNITQRLGISIEGRHRAAGDALATVQLFEHLLQIEGNGGDSFSEVSAIAFKDLHPKLRKQSIENLPDESGVYYFFNEKEDLIYIGKSINIRKRVLTHLKSSKGIKAADMRQQIVEISCEKTGSELIALLLESAEIKKHMPIFNRQQRRSTFTSGIYFKYDSNGYINFYIDKNRQEDMPLSAFTSRKSAISFLEMLTERFNMCHKLTGLYSSTGACFHYGIGKCLGACCAEETTEEYNERAVLAIQSFEFKYKNFLLLDKGRSRNEKSIVKVENGKYLGFGYVDIENFDGDIELLKDCVKPYVDNRDVQSIIKNYLKSNKVEQVITY